MAKIEPCVVGMSAPQFSLVAATPNLDLIQIGAENFEGGWAMLIFYPRDFSLVCPTELTGFSAEKEHFEKLNCEILGMSIDPVESHIRWLSTPEQEGGVQGLRFPLASDPGGEVCKRFGVWREEMELPNRGLFLIDPNWTLRYSVTHDLSVGRNTKDVLRVLNGLMTGGLCPANWKRADGVLDVSSMLRPGRVLGNFRMERELGRGGFGQVWLATDLRLERQIALKIISDQSEAAEKNLLREARLAAGINHPNVCTIYSVDSIDTLPVIAMEFVESGTLSDAIKKGINRSEFNRLAFEIADGLAAAHRRKVVHGDLKPANILLNSRGKAIIADFGLANATSKLGLSVESKESLPDARATTQQTDSKSPESYDLDETIYHGRSSSHANQMTSDYGDDGKIIGTPAFMSPEQATGQPVCESSDIFSLGLIYSSMLTGDTVYGDLSPVEIIKSLGQTEFVNGLKHKLPPLMRGRFASMLALDPTDRPSAAEVCSLLLHEKD